MQSNTGCVCVCLSVYVCVCLYVCVISTAQTENPILMKFSINVFDRILPVKYRKGIRFRTPLARMPIALSLLLGFVLSKLDLLLKILFYLYHVSFFW